jgi:O-methyltransferase
MESVRAKANSTSMRMRHGLTQEWVQDSRQSFRGQPDSALPVWLKTRVTQALPGQLLAAYRFFRTGDWNSAMRFVSAPEENISFLARLQIICKFYRVSAHVPCEHQESEILDFASKVFTLSSEVQGCIVEAGSYKGGGTAKLSIAAKLAHRRLVVFDSFEGIPPHEEPHEKTIWGGPVGFARGDYRGSLEEVRSNVGEFGEIDACEFIKGYFEETLRSFQQSVAAAFLDVDLAGSTRTCLKHLWPLLVPGGFLFSHDGHLPLVLEVFEDDCFWQQELGCERPEINGLGQRKLIWMQKPTA